MSVHDIVTSAANRYGIDPYTLVAISRLESGFNPSAQNPNSSAGGLFQFIDSTAEQYGLTDKFDPVANADAGARLTRDNSLVLEQALGRQPTAGELYLAHQQGATGATRLLSNPDAKAIDIVGTDAVRLNGGDENMTARQFSDLWVNKANTIVTPQREGDAELNLPVPQNPNDKALQARLETQPDIWAGVRNAFASGQMTPDQEQIYLSGVQSGEIPKVAAPTGVVNAYLSGQMTPEQQGQFEAAIDAGLWAMPDESVPQTEEGRSIFQEIARQAGLGARGAAQGAAGLGGIVSDPFVAVVNLFRGNDAQLPFLRNATKQALDNLGLPDAENRSERIVQAVYEGAVGGAGFAGGANLAARGVTNFVGAGLRNLAAQPGIQTLGGVGAGGGAQFAAEEGLGDSGQVVAALGGGIGAATLPGVAANVARVAPQVLRGMVPQPRAVRDAAQAGIDVLTTDVFPPLSGPGQLAQRAGESIPVLGTGGARVAQQQQRLNAIEGLFARYTDGAAPPKETVANIANDFLEQNRTAINSLTAQKGQVFANADGLVPVSGTIRQIDEEIAKLQEVGTGTSRAIIGRLRDWRANLINKPIGVVDDIRKEMGSAFTGQNDAEILEVANKVIRRLYGPIKQDMGNFIKDTAGESNFVKWNTVNQKLTDIMGNFGNTAFRNVLRKGDQTPEAVLNMLRSRDPSTVDRLFRRLSPVGKANARAAIVYDILEKTTSADRLSPPKFVSAVNKAANQLGVFFTKQQRDEINGLARALNLTRRSETIAANPATGQQNFITNLGILLTGASGTALSGGGTGMSAAGALGLGATTGVIARALESEPARNLFIALSRSRRGSPEEIQIAKRLLGVMQNADVLGTVQNNKDDE